ncbi:hypothetical protein D3C85_1669360 [compost metagenome]
MAQRLGNAECLAGDAQQFGIDRALRIGLIVGLVALTAQGQHAGLLQSIQLAHEAAFTHLSPAGDLVGVKTAVGFAEQQAQHFLLSGREQGFAEGKVFHSGNR